jgi:hypothetical protein
MKYFICYTKTSILIICVANLLLILSGCKKDTKVTPVTATVKGPFLYIGGSAQSGGAYLKISLSEPNAAIISDTIGNTKRISSIITSGNDVYIAAQTAGYWKNKTFIPVSGASGIQFLALSETTVYSAGFDNSSNLAYWTDNTEVNLSTTIGRSLFPYQGTSVYSITGITASGSGALVSGQLFTQNEPGSPASAPSGNYGLLWQNSNVKLLGQGYFTSVVYNSTAGVAVSGNDVYVAGRIPDATYGGGYWKNGVWNAINNGAFLPYAIASSGSDVYISGYTFTGTLANTQGVYWKNGTLNTINNSLSATTFVANGSDLYIVGIDSNDYEVVWKNGALLKTIGPAATSITPFCMAVGN